MGSLKRCVLTDTIAFDPTNERGILVQERPGRVHSAFIRVNDPNIRPILHAGQEKFGNRSISDMFAMGFNRPVKGDWWVSEYDSINNLYTARFEDKEGIKGDTGFILLGYNEGGAVNATATEAEVVFSELKT